nr:hypothetical protein [Tanacetum cinerariifolium]
KLESELWNHKMVGSDIDGHMARFHELASSKIKLHVTSSEPATIQVAVSMANRLTTDGIKDGLFKKKENARNKRRSNDQNRNRGRDDRNKTKNWRELCSDYSRARDANERPRLTCFECGDPNHFKRNCPRMNRVTTSGGNSPNPVLEIEGNTNQWNSRNRA